MKKNLLTSIYLFAVVAIIGTSWSCTKDSSSTPQQSTSSSMQKAASSDDEALVAGEIVTANVTPGIYSILRFIDSGDDHTADFNGYTFQFKADGTLIATKNGVAHIGTWNLKNNDTKMAIIISGTKALNNLSDDSWNVVKLTNHRIVLKKAGPDKVVL